MTYRIVILVIVEVGLGILFSLLPTWFATSEFALTLLTNIAVSFFAVALLTLLIEPLTRRQMQESVDSAIQMTQESIDSAFKKFFADDKIFSVVRNSIVRPAFLLRDFKLILELSWADETKEHLIQTTTMSYLVENLTDTEAEYTLHYGDKVFTTEVFAGYPEVNQLFTYIIDDLTERNQRDRKQFTLDEIAQATRFEDGNFIVELPEIKIPSRSLLGVEAKYRSVRLEKDFMIFTLTKIADGLEVTVFHPNDLNISESLLHPSTEKYQEVVRTENVKHYLINTGVLPAHGIFVDWRKK